ncbi:MAG: class I SAM-dependent methyltransferase [Candidatus Levybacteria bacterium]|nr:class I SAM-dependent methyltransferase [Candidatus Levybacteria bacterium]
MIERGINPPQKDSINSLVELRRAFRRTHNNRQPLNDDTIDKTLELPLLGDDQEQGGKDGEGFITVNGREEFIVYQGTPYNLIREGINWVKPTSSDVVYDLGCGYGRVCLYGALTTRAKWKGIDVVKSRLSAARRTKKRLNIPNVEFIQGNVVDQDLSDGTIFYLFNPFNADTQAEVVNKLKEIAEKKPIRILSYWTWYSETDHNNIPSWLRLINQSRQNYYFMQLASK